jgi:hypothetical protein
MDEAGTTTKSRIVMALIEALQAQGHEAEAQANAYPVHGVVDIEALADSVETALGGLRAEDDGRNPAELNAANDG